MCFNCCDDRDIVILVGVDIGIDIGDADVNVDEDRVWLDSPFCLFPRDSNLHKPPPLLRPGPWIHVISWNFSECARSCNGTLTA